MHAATAAADSPKPVRQPRMAPTRPRAAAQQAPPPSGEPGAGGGSAGGEGGGDAADGDTSTGGFSLLWLLAILVNVLFVLFVFAALGYCLNKYKKRTYDSGGFRRSRRTIGILHGRRRVCIFLSLYTMERLFLRRAKPSESLQMRTATEAQGRQMQASRSQSSLHQTARISKQCINREDEETENNAGSGAAKSA